MGDPRLRVMALGLMSLVMIIVGTLVLDWFVFHIPIMGLDHFSVDLRSVHACRSDGVCGSAPMSMAPAGLYSTFATLALWSSLAFAGLVVLQTGARVLSASASASLSKTGYMLGVAVMLLAIASGYLFGFEVGGADVPELGISVHVDRTWAPVVLLLGDLAGIAALFSAVHYNGGLATVTAPELATARALPSKYEAPLKSEPILKVAPERVSSPIPVFPDQLRRKLKFVVLTAEITRAGVDARREDGSTVLVMWRDVVGVVARRLPTVHDGATFVDLVSSAGSTLRFLPWTRITGERIEGEGEHRACTMVELVAARCPEAKLDPATRAFIERRGDAAQLPDVETLAAHDQRLA